MQSVSSQMFSEKSLASNSSYGVVKGTEKFPVTDGLLEVPKPTGTNVGGVLAPYGYHIDEDGRLQENKFEFIEKMILGYSVCTSQPDEWYSGETVVEQDLSDTTFSPASTTWYKHTGADITNSFKTNGLYYYNGTTYISFYENTGTLKEPVYAVLTEQKTFEAGNYYRFVHNGITSPARYYDLNGNRYKFSRLLLKWKVIKGHGWGGWYININENKNYYATYTGEETTNGNIFILVEIKNGMLYSTVNAVGCYIPMRCGIQLYSNDVNYISGFNFAHASQGWPTNNEEISIYGAWI